MTWRFPAPALLVALLLLLLLLLLPAAQAEISIEDDRGTAVSLEQPAARIVTLAPHLAELVFDAGLGDRLVGTVEWSNHPPAALDVPRIGDSFRVDAERIIALQPDLVLAWGGGTPANTIERLENLGLEVAVLTPDHLASIPQHLEWLGKATGQGDQAGKAALHFRQRLAQLREQYAGRQPIRVFYQISGQPLFTVGEGHTISELITLCGGKNIFSDLDERAHAVSREAVVTRDPDVIIAGRYEGSGDELGEWQRWKQVSAVRRGNLLSIDAELVARPAAGILEGGAALCRTLDDARDR